MTFHFARPRPLYRAVSIAIAAAAAHASISRPARADGSAAGDTFTVPPPPSQHSSLQYGVALAAEIVASAGPACSQASAPCILGSGGGIVARAGWRPSEQLYIGGAYEMSKQDPHQLYRLAILQQVRAEVRIYFPTGRETSPFMLLCAGVSAYGNDWWPVDTYGPSGGLGGGLELQLGGPVLVVSLAYRPMYFHTWVDSSTLNHDGGFAHFVGLEASIEAQDNL
jgi:hypothetical protein